MKSSTLLPNTIAALVLSLGAFITHAQAGSQKPIAGRTAKPKAAKAAKATGPAKQATPKLTATTSRYASQLASAKRSMEYIINNGYGKGGGDTPPMEAYLESKGTMSRTGWGDHVADIPPENTLSGLADGNVRFTVLLPVSGHVSASETQRYAKENVYEVRIVHADGSIESLPKVKSTGLVTQAQLDFKLKPGTSQLQFWPIGSAGTGGYANGRVIKLKWDGKTAAN